MKGKRLALSLVLVMVLVGLTGLFGATDSDADDQYFTEDGIRYLVTEASGLKVSVADSNLLLWWESSQIVCK